MGCTSISPSIVSSEESQETVNEKFIHDPLAQVAYTPHIKLTQSDGTTIAYKAFLNAFPEYRLTWILDTLHRSDFARLDHTGETYVDYMGGGKLLYAIQV
jgi:hypothetical protein